MWMAGIPQQSNPMASTDPRRDGITIADLPVQAFLRFVHGSSDPRVNVVNDLSHFIHIPRLEPTLFDVFGVLVCQDPVEFVSITQRILHQVHIISNPDVAGFPVYELRT